MGKWSILVFFLFLVIFVFALRKLTISDNNAYKEAQIIKNEYITLNKNYSSTINGNVLKKELSVNRYAKGAFLIELSNGIKIALAGGTINYLYGNQFDLMSFVEIGDSISKSGNSDSIFIYRNNIKYYFILGEILNKK